MKELIESVKDFKIIDFNKDGIIKKEDAKIILSYLPLNEINEEKQDKKDLVSKIFGAQIKSLEEIDSIVSDTFDKYGGQMNLSQFTEIVKEKNSEIFLQILCFLYEQMPFSSKNIEALKQKYNLVNDDDYEQISASFRKYKKSGSIRIKAPKQSTMLSPARSFLKNFSIRKLSLNENIKDNSTISTSSQSNKMLEENKETDNISINSSSPSLSANNAKEGENRTRA